MHREKRHRFLLRVGPTFGRARLAGPGVRHRLCKRSQAANAVRPGQAQEQVDVGEWTFGLAAMALQQDRAYVQRVDRLGDQLMRGGRVDPAPEPLKLAQHVPREGMRNRVQVHVDVQVRKSVRPLRCARLRPDKVEQLFLGQPDQRSPEQRTQCERVSAISEHARDRDQILHLLPLVEALAGLRGDRDPALLQRLLVAPQVLAGWRKESDVAGSARTLHPGPTVGDLMAADQACDQLREGLGLTVALPIGRRFAVLARARDRQGGDAQAVGGIGMKGIERGEPRLPLVLAHMRFEPFVHEGKDTRTGPEVGRDAEQILRALSADRVACPDIGGDIGTPEAVDRLFGITDEKQCAGPDPIRLPVGGIGSVHRVAAQAPEDLQL